jgi:hypothetical protein
MKRILLLLLAATVIGAPVAQASDVDFGLDLHIGTRSGAPVVVNERPMFLAPAELGFHVAVGVPYDMFFIGGTYYVCKDHHWYRGPSYNGPWQGVGPKHLPHGLVKKRYRDIIRARDVEYARYKKDKRHYKGKPYYPKEVSRSQGKGKNKSNMSKSPNHQSHQNDKHVNNRKSPQNDRNINKGKSNMSKGNGKGNEKNKRSNKGNPDYPEDSRWGHG